MCMKIKLILIKSLLHIKNSISQLNRSYNKLFVFNYYFRFMCYFCQHKMGKDDVNKVNTLTIRVNIY